MVVWIAVAKTLFSLHTHVEAESPTVLMSIHSGSATGFRKYASACSTEPARFALHAVALLWTLICCICIDHGHERCELKAMPAPFPQKPFLLHGQADPIPSSVVNRCLETNSVPRLRSIAPLSIVDAHFYFYKLASSEHSPPAGPKECWGPARVGYVSVGPNRTVASRRQTVFSQTLHVLP